MNLEEILKNFRYYKSPDGKFLLPFEGDRCCLNVVLRTEEIGSVLITGWYPVLVKWDEETIEFLARLSSLLDDLKLEVGLSSGGIITVRARMKPEEVTPNAVQLVADVTEAVGDSLFVGGSLEERVNLFISATKDLPNRIEKHLKESGR